MGLRIGTSGWSYPTGKGKWNGLFYPATRSKRAGTKDFDELRFYAEHFDTVEVNTTFYGQPRPEVTRGWAERTPPGFEFSLKLYQKFTHPKMFREAALKRAPGSEGPLLDLLAQVTQSDIDEFRAGIEPLAASGKLGALLAQFPPSFKDSPASRDYLAQLLRVFSDYPMAVELRHSSWSDAIGDTLAMLNAFGAAWVQIDEPKFRFSIRQNYLPNVTRFYYMRLHGRNAAQWWRHDEERGPLQLPVFRGRAAGVLRHRRRGEGAGEEVVPLHEQPLLREVGGERRDAEGAARGADRGRVSARAGRALSGDRRPGDAKAASRRPLLRRLLHGYSLDDVGDCEASRTTSMPEITWPKTV